MCIEGRSFFRDLHGDEPAQRNFLSWGYRHEKLGERMALKRLGKFGMQAQISVRKTWREHFREVETGSFCNEWCRSLCYQLPTSLTFGFSLC